MRLVVSPEADLSTDEFFVYIAEENLQAAIRFLDRLQETYSVIQTYPEIAPQYPALDTALKSIRWFPVKDYPNHLIFYSRQEDTIEIVQIFHKSQDITAILEKEK